jgi:hypothetical protein
MIQSMKNQNSVEQPRVNIDEIEKILQFQNHNEKGNGPKDRKDLNEVHDEREPLSQ